MNPEDLDLPQPPEGVLHPTMPWSRINPNSRLWLILKSKLTGRRQGDESYTSYVNLSDADADRLIENIKKDPRGYPSLDQESGTPIEWMERQRIYQEWLVEEYLEKPFRKKVDQKIEEAEIERRVNEIQEKKKEIADTLNNKPQPEVQPQDKLLPADPLDIPDPWEGSETIPNIVTPVTTEPTLLLPPAKDPEPEVEKPQQEKKQKKEKSFIIPETLSPEVRTTIRNFAGNLDSIRRQMSKQTRILQRREGNYRRIINGLESTKFLLGQQVENYREALDDLETQQRVTKAYSAPIGPQPMESPTPWAAAGPEDVGNEQGFTPRLPAEKLSEGGFLNTPYPGRFAEGGVNVAPNFAEKMLKPGIYDNPTIGTLPPNSAVIPLNRNSGKELMGQYDTQQYIQALGETMYKPMNALLGGAIANVGSVIKSLGAFAGYFSAGVQALIGPLSSLLKVSSNTILDLLGGPAYAGEEDSEERNSFYDSWKTFMKENNLFFKGLSALLGGGGGGNPEISKDIAVISSKEDLRYVGGTNVNASRLPAWIPFSKADSKKIGYVSGFGMRGARHHSGIDLDGDRGIRIISPMAGEVYVLNKGVVREQNPADGGGYGNFVGIKYGSPKVWMYFGHMKEVADGLQVGSKVSAGQVIGTIGNTGHSTGPHLHWEVRQSASGGQVDPVEWTHQNKVSGSLGAPTSPRKNIMDYPEYEIDRYTQYDKDKIVRMNNKLYKINSRGALGDEVSIDSLESGGQIKIKAESGVSAVKVQESKQIAPTPVPKMKSASITPVVSADKSKPKVYNIEAPTSMAPSFQMMSAPATKIVPVFVDISTNDIIEINEIRRMM